MSHFSTFQTLVCEKSSEGWMTEINSYQFTGWLNSQIPLVNCITTENITYTIFQYSRSFWNPVRRMEISFPQYTEKCTIMKTIIKPRQISQGKNKANSAGHLPHPYPAPACLGPAESKAHLFSLVFHLLHLTPPPSLPPHFPQTSHSAPGWGFELPALLEWWEVGNSLQCRKHSFCFLIPFHCTMGRKHKYQFFEKQFFYKTGATKAPAS